MNFKARSAEASYDEEKVQLATAVLKEHLIKRGAMKSPVAEGSIHGGQAGLARGQSKLAVPESASPEALLAMRQTSLLTAQQCEAALCAIQAPTGAAQGVARQPSVVGQGLRELRRMLGSPREQGDISGGMSFRFSRESAARSAADVPEPGVYPCTF
jgi:hypothetical protein